MKKEIKDKIDAYKGKDRQIKEAEGRLLTDR
jgi:hypothetical protein